MPDLTPHARTPGRRLRRALAASVLAALVASPLVPAAPAGAQEPAAEESTSSSEVQASAMPATLAVGGHGWGHGRGMGQFGSFGYATGRSGGPWTHQQILGHFYGGTTVGHITANPLMAVLLKSRTGSALVVHREAGMEVPGVAGAPKAVRVTLRPDGQFDVQTGTGCLDTTGSTPVQVPGPVRVKPAAGSGTTALRVCSGDGSSIAYRGELLALGRDLDDDAFSDGKMRTVNLVVMDELMRGVVPRESPASWGDAEGGLGMHALRAQAVAARSYAAAGDSRWGNLHDGVDGQGNPVGARATTCDDIFCQVYGGIASISPSGAITDRTHPNTDQAIADTANEVRMKDGAVARTEFSSSTGGWTAGGTFPAVVDEGDAVSANPNHDWATTLDRSAIEARYGLGTLTDVQVISRNGLGAEGGRVTIMRLVGTAGSEDVTGNQFRSAFGLKSDWFSISVPAIPPRSIDTACPPGEVPDGAFGDVAADNVHRRAIDCVAWRQISEGTGGSSFSPALPVTRAQMASFAARLVSAAGGSLPSSPPDAFSDDDGSTHEQAINQLAAVGVVNGVSDGRYAPQVHVDRAQLASMLARALDHLGVVLQSSPPAAFDDDAGVHEEAIDQLAAEGVVTGIKARTYQPSATARRDQMASMLARALDYALDEP